MLTQRLRYWLVLIAVVCAAGVFLFTALHAAVLASSSHSSDLSVPDEKRSNAVMQVPASLEENIPVRIRIPKIEVDASVVDVGLGKTGNMAVPLEYADVGWYRYGPKPGERGSAVMDGHVDNGLGLKAVFARLGELGAGDDIYIETNAGDTLHFKIEESSVYDVAEVPLTRVFNRTDVARLNLITCEGIWIQDEKMYDQRRVVYAVLAP